MSRSFNPSFITEKNKRSPNGPVPINLVTFNFSTPVYLSDRDVTPSGGSLHSGLVKKWGFIDSHVGRASGSGFVGRIEACDMELVVINSESTPFSDNFAADDPPENVTVEVYQWFKGLLYSQKELIFKGFVNGLPKFDLYECRVMLRGIWEKYNRLIGEDLIVNAATYPNADPDDIGKMLPLGWGQAKNVPFRAVEAGAISTLAADITSSATTITLSDSSRFPSSGTVYIGSEQITYTGNSGNQLTGCTRGANGTTAQAHSAGEGVAEKKSSYVYLMGSAVKAVNAVYVNNVRQVSGFTAYTGQTGDEHPSYSAKAAIAFSALPVNRKLLDTIDYMGRGSYRCNYAYSGGSYVELPYSWNNVTTGKTLSGNGNDFVPSFTGSKNNNGFSVTIHWRVTINSLGTTGTLELKMDNPYVGSSYGTTLFKIVSGAIDTEVSHPFIYHTTQNVPNGSTRFICSSGGGFDGDVDFVVDAVEIEFHGYEHDTDRSGIVSFTGNSVADTVIGGQVTADVDGYQDDGSGTYTGTPGLLIERPDHFFKHVWNAILGASLSDVDATTFTASGTFYSTNTYKFALVIQEPVMADVLLARLAVQCRSHFFVTLYGKAKLIVRQLGQSSGHAVTSDEMRENSVFMERSAVSDLVNYFNIHYDLDHSRGFGKENCRAVKSFSDATSISRYGLREWKGDANLFLFDAVQDDAMANHVGAFWLDFLKLVRSMPNLDVFLDNMEIEPGDIIDLTHDLDDMSSFVCEVLKIQHFPGSALNNEIDHLKITAMEN